MFRRSMTALSVLLVTVSATSVAEEQKEFIKPAEVRGVYQLQGEYVGETIP